MDVVAESLMIVALFSAMHERFIEILRAVADRLLGGCAGLVDELTIGPFNWLTAIGLAMVTQANLFALWRPNSHFIDHYMAFDWSLWAIQDWFGALVMGAAATLGSQFWHDLAKGLADMRRQSSAIRRRAEALSPPPPSPPASFATSPPG